MINRFDENTLVERHYVSLIVRLLVDHHGQVINGELVDATNTFRKHFIDEQGLTAAVHTWLTQQEQGSDERASGSQEANHQ
jgi:hypothetical protein